MCEGPLKCGGPMFERSLTYTDKNTEECDFVGCWADL